MPPATTTPATPERTIIIPGAETPVDPERIALRSSLPSPPTKPPEPRKVIVPDASEAEVRNRFAELVKPEPVKKAEPKPASRLPAEVPPAKPKQPTNKDLDRAYFPTRAMLPELTILGVVIAGWFMVVVPYLPEWLQEPEVIASVPGTYGLFVMVRWLYRVIGGGYRLTRSQLLRINAGPIPDPEPIDLAGLATVAVEQSALDWCLAVGCVKLTFERETHPEVLLGPVGWPRRRAKLIEVAMAKAREGTVTAGRIAA